MRKCVQVFLIVSAIAALIAYVLFWRMELKIMPTRSSANMLTVVKDGYPAPARITVENYTNDAVNEYVLDFKINLRSLDPQKYKMPELSDGRAEVSVELEDDDGTLTVNYDRASDLYDRGLLICFSTDYPSSTEINGSVYRDHYIYFISGNDRVYYAQKGINPGWLSAVDVPKQRKFIFPGLGGYYPHQINLWKENKWEVFENTR